MIISPDVTQAGWELGSACFGLLNIRAVRRSKSIAGVHWAPTAFFAGWGIYNLWFYSALHLPVSWWAGIAITVVNLTWLGHLGWYWRQRRRELKAMETLLSKIGHELSAMYRVLYGTNAPK